MPSVPGFVHTPGNHCGSTALRNLPDAGLWIEVDAAAKRVAGAEARLWHSLSSDTAASP
jgi:hypothetical protein